MANRKWEALRGSVGFYVTMAVCLLAVGISGYFLLLDKEEATPQQETLGPVSMPEETGTAEPVTEPEVPEEHIVVETILPTPVEAEALPEPLPELDDTPVVAEAPILTVSPLEGEVVTVFSVDELVYNATLEDWRIHDGMDIAAREGAAVMAACAGTVASVTDDALMGTTVVIDHDGGYQTTYANLQAAPSVAAGDHVSAGEVIGTVGTTAAAEAASGPHLHFSVSKDGDTVDPSEFLDR